MRSSIALFAALASGVVAAQDASPLRQVAGTSVSRLEAAAIVFEDLDRGTRVELVAVPRCADDAFAEVVRAIGRGADRCLTDRPKGPPAADIAITASSRLLELVAPWFGLKSTAGALMEPGAGRIDLGLSREEVDALFAANGFVATPADPLLDQVAGPLGFAREWIDGSPPDAGETGWIAAARRHAARAIVKVLADGPEIYRWLRRPEDRARDEGLTAPIAARIDDEIDRLVAGRNPPGRIAIAVDPAAFGAVATRLRQRSAWEEVERRWLPAWTIRDPGSASGAVRPPAKPLLPRNERL